VRPIDQQFARAVERMLGRHIRIERPPMKRTRAILCGSLDDVSLSALLPMLEMERKSGQLVLANGGIAVTIELVHGQIADARSTAAVAASAEDIVLGVLDWTHGTFDLFAGAPAATAPAPAAALSATQLLLEHARRRDESSRAHRVAQLRTSN
jgi:hypothetical protein